MIRPLLLSLLLLTAATAVVSAQNSDRSFAPMPPSIACPAAGVTPSQTPRMARKKIKGKNVKYPRDAKKAHIEGLVVLKAVISESGDVEELCVSQGPVMLQRAAFDAVKTWKYKPITWKGQPVAVETQIDVNFILR